MTETTRNARDDSGDYGGEMTRRNRPDERAVSALFSGQVPGGREDLADVAAFAASLRTAAGSTAPRPNAALATVLAEGLSTAAGDLPVTAASDQAGTEQSRSRGVNGRARSAWESAIARLAALGLAAKVGVMGVALVAGATGAGAAGVLPDQAQEAFGRAVQAVTPFGRPDVTDEDGPAEGGAADRADAEHGETVSDVARDGETEGCERGRLIARTAGGRSDSDCPPTAELDSTAPPARQPATPGREGRSTADEATDHGEQGRDTADDAASDGRSFGESRPPEDPQREGEGADAPAARRDTGAPSGQDERTVELDDSDANDANAVERSAESRPDRPGRP